MEKFRNISKSMVSYLKKVNDHKEFVLKETKQYEESKRHLANIMGIESNEMTQEEVDVAIKYLFPSVKDAQFDEQGRPHHYLFYTGFPNYYDTLGQLTDNYEELNNYEDKQVAKGILEAPKSSKYDLLSKRPLTHIELCDLFIENISIDRYNYFNRSFLLLIDHPYSVHAKEFIEKYTKPLAGTSVSVKLPPILKDQDGRSYAEMITRRREHKLQTRVTFNGTGKIDIENKDILYFQSPIYRQQIYFPIKMSGMQDKIDIYSRFVSRPKCTGESSVAGAIREAVSRSIAAYTDPETRERMRVAGLLTTDTRLKERKKYGQEGARRKFTWLKR